MTIVGDFVTGTNVPYQRLRALHQALGDTQEGVVGAGDLKVSQRAVGGANMSVDIAPGDAWIDIDSGVRSGRAHAFSDAIENRAVAASHATLPRIDLVVFRYNDTSIPAGAGGNTPTLEVLTGAPTASVTLDAPGASPPALPNDALLIGMILVPAASTSVVTANIRDRRKWARGAFRTLSPATTGNYQTSSTSYAAISTTDLQPRIECSGAPLLVRINGSWQQSGAFDVIYSTLGIDGAVIANGAQTLRPALGQANSEEVNAIEWIATPTPGSHLIAPFWRVNANTGTFQKGSGTAPVLVIEEMIRQNADNS